jgi:hypothetical protein
VVLGRSRVKIDLDARFVPLMKLVPMVFLARCVNLVRFQMISKTFVSNVEVGRFRRLIKLIVFTATRRKFLVVRVLHVTFVVLAESQMPDKILASTARRERYPMLKE